MRVEDCLDDNGNPDLFEPDECCHAGCVPIGKKTLNIARNAVIMFFKPCRCGPYAREKARADSSGQPRGDELPVAPRQPFLG